MKDDLLSESEDRTHEWTWVKTPRCDAHGVFQVQQAPRWGEVIVPEGWQRESEAAHRGSWGHMLREEELAMYWLALKMEWTNSFAFRNISLSNEEGGAAWKGTIMGLYLQESMTKQ